MQSSGLIDEPVFDQRKDRLKAIPPAYFFSFPHRPVMVRNRDLFDSVAFFADLSGYLGTKLEALALKRQALEHIRFECLIAGRLVSNPGAIKKIGHGSQNKNSHLISCERKV